MKRTLVRLCRNTQAFFVGRMPRRCATIGYMAPQHLTPVRGRLDSHARLHHGDPAAVVEVALDVLRDTGERVTEPRRVVIEVLAITTQPIGAEQLVAAIEAIDPGIHRATVYRTLDLFSDLGIVSQLQSASGAALYHLAAVVHGHEHLHGRCRECGRIVDLPADALDDATARLAGTFRLEPGKSALVGLCSACARAIT